MKNVLILKKHVRVVTMLAIAFMLLLTIGFVIYQARQSNMPVTPVYSLQDSAQVPSGDGPDRLYSEEYIEEYIDIRLEEMWRKIEELEQLIQRFTTDIESEINGI